jgi:hypothetical protein
LTYTIQFTDSLAGTPVWNDFLNNGTKTPTGTTSFFVDDFSSGTSGAPSPTGSRFYRVSYTLGE